MIVGRKWPHLKGDLEVIALGTQNLSVKRYLSSLPFFSFLQHNRDSRYSSLLFTLFYSKKGVIWQYRRRLSITILRSKKSSIRSKDKQYCFFFKDVNIIMLLLIQDKSSPKKYFSRFKGGKAWASLRCYYAYKNDELFDRNNKLKVKFFMPASFTGRTSNF